MQAALVVDPLEDQAGAERSGVRKWAMFEVPPVVRRKALLADAGAWLDALPVLSPELEHEWQLKVARPSADRTPNAGWGRTGSQAVRQVCDSDVVGQHRNHKAQP